MTITRPTALVLLVSLAALAVGTVPTPLWDEDEPRFAAIARTMVETGDWVVPIYNEEENVANLLAEVAEVLLPHGPFEALLVALTEWPRSGVPDNPGAWLTATARRRALDDPGRAHEGPTWQPP